MLKISDVLNKRYVRNFLLLTGLIFVAGTLISAAVLYADIYQPLHTHYGAVISIISGLKETLIAKTLKINLIFYLFISAGIGMLSVLYSHRVAGPLSRIKKFLTSITDGKPDKALKLRHKDAIASFASAINEMTGAYRQKSLELISEVDQLKKSVNELELLAEQGRPVDETLEKIIDIDKGISGLLKTVKVNDT